MTKFSQIPSLLPYSIIISAAKHGKMEFVFNAPNAIILIKMAFVAK